MSTPEQVISANPTPRPGDPSISDRRFRVIGFLIILIVFFGLGTWAAIAPLASAAHAPGKVRVEGNRKTIQHLEGGIVKTLTVRDGDYVKQGQVLMTLEDTQARAQLEVVRGQYFIALAREARLIAQRDELGAVQYPETLLYLKDDARVREAIDVQDQIFKVRKLAYENEIALYAQKAEQLEAQLEGLEAQKASSQSMVNSYGGELRDMRSLEKEGYAERRRVRELERQVAENQGRLGELIARIASTRSEIVEAKLQSLQLQKELQREVAAELNEVQERLFQLVEQHQALRDTLSRTVIKAPQAGTVLELSVHTIGAVIREGEKLMDIVPEGERLVVEAKVSPVDIDRVAVGQTADIRFSAFKVRETPRIGGTLKTLSADSVVDPNDSTQTPYYVAVLEITDEGVRQLAGNELTLVAGMPAEVFIKTGERTLFQYLADPLVNTVARAFIED
jgi:epimerase transport system membrane fusion protein